MILSKSCKGIVVQFLGQELILTGNTTLTYGAVQYLGAKKNGKIVRIPEHVVKRQIEWL